MEITGHPQASLPEITVFQFNTMVHTTRLEQERSEIAAAKDACLTTAANDLKICERTNAKVCNVAAGVMTGVDSLICAVYLPTFKFQAACTGFVGGFWAGVASHCIDNGKRASRPA